MRESPLPYWAYLVAGVLITSISLLVYSINQSAGMRLFSGIGIIFMLIGGGKFLLKQFGNTEKKAADKLAGVNVDKTVKAIERQHNREEEKITHHHVRQPELIRCQRCHTINYDHSNFCHMCGYKL